MTHDRRDFLTKLGLGAVALSGGAIVTPLGAEELDRMGEAFAAEPAWNMSWVRSRAIKRGNLTRPQRQTGATSRHSHSALPWIICPARIM